MWGDEFEEQLTPEDLGFVDPSSYSDGGGDLDNPRPSTSSGELDMMGDDGEGKDGDAAVTVGEGDNVLLVGGGGKAEEAGGEAAAGAADITRGVPVPRPMDIEEPEWDANGDCVPLPAWKVGHTG